MRQKSIFEAIPRIPIPFLRHVYGPSSSSSSNVTYHPGNWLHEGCTFGHNEEKKSSAAGWHHTQTHGPVKVSKPAFGGNNDCVPIRASWFLLHSHTLLSLSIVTGHCWSLVSRQISCPGAGAPGLSIAVIIRLRRNSDGLEGWFGNQTFSEGEQSIWSS